MCGVALPKARSAGPEAAGAAAHRSAHRPLLFPPALSPAAGAMGGTAALRSPAAVVAEFCLDRGSQQPFRRAASAGQADPAGNVLDCPRQLHHAGKADRRGIRPFAERRVFVGEPEFSGRTARGGSSRRKAGAGHRRRKAGRHIGQNRRNRGPHQSHRRHDAGHPRTGRGGRAAAHRHSPHRAGRHPHLRTRRRGRLCPIRLGARADRAADRFHKTPDRAAVQPPYRFV